MCVAYVRLWLMIVFHGHAQMSESGIKDRRLRVSSMLNWKDCNPGLGEGKTAAFSSATPRIPCRFMALTDTWVPQEVSTRVGGASGRSGFTSCPSIRSSLADPCSESLPWSSISVGVLHIGLFLLLILWQGLVLPRWKYRLL